MAFGIATNPYDAMMSIAKGDLRQIIWGGLIFDPGTHNPDDPTPVGNIMRMNLVVDDSGQKIANKMAVFFNSGQNIPGGRYGAIVLDIDCAYPNEIADTVHNWEGWQQCDFLINGYFGPQDAGKECFVIFDDDSYTSGQFYYWAEDAGWDCHVTFGEDAELDAILENSETTENYNRAAENLEWPVQALGAIHTVRSSDGEYDTCYYGTAEVPRISFNNYPEGVDSPGETIVTFGIRGLQVVESIELENGETAVADYHGDDGDSFLVECAIYRNPDFNLDEPYPIDPSLFRAWRQRDVLNGDPYANSRIVIEVYPNVAYIQNSQCWMAIRKVYRCVEVDGNFVYTLYTDENNRENMPFIYGKNVWRYWVNPDSAITPTWELEEGDPNYNPDGHMMTTYQDFTDLSGDQWTFKIGDFIGTIDIMNEDDGPFWDDEIYPAGSNEMRLYKINDFMINGVSYEDLDPDVQARIDYPVIAVDITGKMQIDLGNANTYHWETSPDGFLQGLMIASLPAELLEQWQDSESFQQWADTWAEEHDGQYPDYDDVMELITPMEHLCDTMDSFGGGGGWNPYWHYDEEEELQ